MLQPAQRLRFVFGSEARTPESFAKKRVDAGRFPPSQKSTPLFKFPPSIVALTQVPRVVRVGKEVAVSVRLGNEFGLWRATASDHSID